MNLHRKPESYIDKGLLWSVMAAFTVFLFVGLLLGLAWGKWNTSYGIIVLVTTICLELLLYPIGKRFSSFFHGAVGEFKA